MKYPQFIISPCFIPFLFEGYQSANGNGQYKIRIWELVTVINAIYIGCIPQCILCITDYYKGVQQWEFGKGNSSNLHDANFISLNTVESESNDALFKSQYGNTIFAVTTAIFFQVLIYAFFGSSFFCA